MRHIIAATARLMASARRVARGEEDHLPDRKLVIQFSRMNAPVPRKGDARALEAVAAGAMKSYTMSPATPISSTMWPINIPALSASCGGMTSGGKASHLK
jgi:hypothetical protein